MRSGGCAVNQALTTEAASVVKQAVALAKRRGHAQVTPLHVANTMLAVSGGLLRVACMQSHSHPLQCKALELCFNVALNRLPASSSNPILSHHSHIPSISNALVAAFKRAQAHQRRGSADNQQQPLLAVKIELEQLIISILDDPSVSRVMREAGFLSTQVKSNVEKVVSLELCSQNSHPSQKSKSKENKLVILEPSSSPTNRNERKAINTTSSEPIDRNDDLQIIIETLLMSRKKKSFVVVGEFISKIESKVKELMNRVDKGGVPEALREVKFITIPPFYSFCNLQKDLVEQKMGELTYLVNSLVGKGVVLYLGDLNWISEYRVNLEQERSYYCSVEHMIMEIGKLISGIGEIGRFWVMGIATFQTYMRCTNGNNSLETIWRLNPVTIPANSLGLSLISQSNEHTGAREENGSSQQFHTNGEVLTLTCCPDCSSKFEAEAEKLRNEPTFSSLPPWLKDESRRLCNNNQNCDSIVDLSKKWSTYCSSADHKQPTPLERTLTLSSPSPSSSTSCFSFDQQNPNLQQSNFSLFTTEYLPSNPCTTQNSPSSSDIVDTGFGQKFKEFNAIDLNVLCNALEKMVPWQREIIPEIAGTILQCRSGMLRRKDKEKFHLDDVKKETWLLFLGPDSQAKEKISKYLARIVFGSYSNLVSIGISSSDPSEDYQNKRGRNEDRSQSSYIERFAEAVSANPHRVFLVEDLNKADYWSQIRIKRAIESGRISNGSGEEVNFCDAIVILSCERFSSRLTPESSPSSKQKTENQLVIAGEEERSPRVFLDLNTSFDDDSVDQSQFMDDLGILENVDRLVVFKLQNF